MNKPPTAAPFRRSVAVLHSLRVPPGITLAADKTIPVIEKLAVKEVKAIPWPKVLSYACVVFGAGGALLPFVPDHWRVPIVALCGQLQSYLPPVQTYSQKANTGS